MNIQLAGLCLLLLSSLAFSQGVVLTNSLPQTCDDPPPTITDFTSASEAAFVILIFPFNNPAPTGTVGADWIKPDGSLSHTVSTPTGGFFCFYDALLIAGTPTATLGGLWHVKVYHDKAVVADIAFTLRAIPALPTVPSGPGYFGDPAQTGGAACSQPVSITNGNMFHTFEDLRVRSRGLPIALRRTYNSQALSGGPFGPGWTHSYNRSLLDSSGARVYSDETGGRYTFAAQGAGFTPHPGLDMGLTMQADGTILLRTRAGIQMFFTGGGLLTRIADRNGNTQTLTYNSQNLLTRVSDTAGASLVFNYDTRGHIITAQDQSGRRVSYEYDADGNLIASVNAVSARTSYAYYSASTGGFLKTITLPDGSAINYEYGSDQRVSRIVERSGSQQSFTYSYTATVLQDERGVNTTFQFNGAGNITGILRADNAALAMSWSPDDKLMQQTAPGNAVSTAQYDAQGNPLKLTDATGAAIQATWNPQFNVPLTFTDARGNTSKIDYDTRGNPVKLTDALGDQSTLVYDANGNLTTATNPLGASFQATYDAQGNPATFKDAFGNTAKAKFDSLNRLVSLTDPLNNETKFQYDALDRATKVTLPTGMINSVVYDAAGNVTERAAPGGAVTNFGYDKAGDLTQVTDPLGNATTYDYHSGDCQGCTVPGLLTSSKDPAGGTWLFAYDSNRRLISSTDPRGNVTAMTYDARGNVAQRTDATGATIQYQYDAANRLTSRVLPDGSQETFSYDASGNLTTAANANATLTYTYDALNRVISALDSRVAQALTYTYDKAGRRKTMIDPDGGVTNYTYDPNGRLTSLMNPNGQTIAFKYDAAGRRTSVTLPSGITGSYGYDAGARLTALNWSVPANSLLSQWAATYTASANRDTIADLAGSHQYQYDALNRLTSAAHPDGSAENYTYDPAGNRLPSVDAPAPTFDGNGNQLTRVDTRGTTTYSYDGLNRLTGIAFPDGAQAAYKYDALGRRIEKSVNGAVIRYIYDGLAILLEQDANGVTQARYTQGPRIDEPLIMDRGGQSYYYISDGLGSVTQLADSTGIPLQSYGYDSYGNMLAQGTAPAVANPFTYTGREWDAESGLYYFRARYYDAGSGRFLQPDPVSLPNLLSVVRTPGGRAAGATLLNALLRPELNLRYAYAADNPLRRLDPLGLEVQDSTVGDSLLAGVSGSWGHGLDAAPPGDADSNLLARATGGMGRGLDAAPPDAGLLGLVTGISKGGLDFAPPLTPDSGLLTMVGVSNRGGLNFAPPLTPDSGLLTMVGVSNSGGLDFAPPLTPDSGLLTMVGVSSRGGLNFAPTGCSAPGLN